MAARYWQVAAESNQRDYAHEFLRYGLAFVGGEGYIRTMALFRPGDWVLLKFGTSALAAVGEVVERDGRCGGDGPVVAPRSRRLGPARILLRSVACPCRARGGAGADAGNTQRSACSGRPCPGGTNPVGDTGGRAPRAGATADTACGRR